MHTHNVWSCDLLPSDKGGKHFQMDVLTLLRLMPGYFDLMIAHPPCTHTATSGARHFAAKRADGRQQAGIDFFLALVAADVPLKVIEHPISIMSRVFRKPDQIIQPWQFGHGETKATCLWLFGGVPKLVPTNIVSGREAWTHRLPPTDDRWKLRSTTKPGIAQAMAVQWGRLLP